MKTETILTIFEIALQITLLICYFQLYTKTNDLQHDNNSIRRAIITLDSSRIEQQKVINQLIINYKK